MWKIEAYQKRRQSTELKLHRQQSVVSLINPEGDNVKNMKKKCSKWQWPKNFQR
jgi:hypothetical protein